MSYSLSPNLPAAAEHLLLARFHLYRGRHLRALQVYLVVDLGLRREMWERSRAQGRDATVGKDALTIAPHKRSVSKLGLDAADTHIGPSTPPTYLQKELRAT